MKPFLSWVGNKYRLAEKIIPHLPKGNRLIEPFVGSGAIFLNTDYDYYVLNDINPDLINLFEIIKHTPEHFIAAYKPYFSGEYYSPKAYYELRDRFNQIDEFNMERAALFLYLHRHGFNHLCRYNSKGEFNVSWGNRKDWEQSDDAIYGFSEKAQNAMFMCNDYEVVAKSAEPGDILYCDPPYYRLSDTANFTKYSGDEFTIDDQHKLAEIAEEQSRNGVCVVISNHDTKETRGLYINADILVNFDVFRSFGKNGNFVGELIAIYNGY